MSETVGDISVKITAETIELERAMERAKESVAQFGQQTEQLAGSLNALGGVLMAMAPPAFLKGTVNAFAEADLGITKMQTALELYGANVSAVSPRLEELAKQIAATTTFSDSQAISAMTTGLQLGIQADKIEEVTKAAIGLNKMTGGENGLAGSMRLLFRASMGRTEQLGRYGIVLDKTKSKEAQYLDLLKMTTAAYPMAEREAQGLHGQMMQLNKAWVSMKESIGKLITNGIGLIDKLKTLTGWIKSLADAINNLPEMDKNMLAWAATAIVLIPAVTKSIQGLTWAMGQLGLMTIGKKLFSTLILEFQALAASEGVIFALGASITGLAVTVAAGLAVFAGVFTIVTIFDKWLGISERLAEALVEIFGVQDDLAAQASLNELRSMRKQADEGGDGVRAQMMQKAGLTGKEGVMKDPKKQQEIELERELQKIRREVQLSYRESTATSDQEKLNVLIERQNDLHKEANRIANESGKNSKEYAAVWQGVYENDAKIVNLQREMAETQRDGEISQAEKLISLMEDKANWYEKIDLVQREISLNAKRIADEEKKAGHSTTWWQLKNKELELLKKQAEIQDQGGKETMRYSAAAVKGSAEAYKVEIGNNDVQALIAKTGDITAKGVTKLVELTGAFTNKLNQMLPAGGGQTESIALMGGGG